MQTKRRSILLAAVLVPALALGAWTTEASAQATGTIVGQVTDAMSGRPLMDAQVYVPGTGLGVLTNASGRFTLLNVPPGEVTLRVDLIGYSSQEVTVTVAAGQTSTTTFNLDQDAISLEEIVVTGLGKETERRKLSTSVDVLSAEEISQVPVTSVDQLLQGRVAGATINAQSAQAGTAVPPLFIQATMSPYLLVIPSHPPAKLTPMRPRVTMPTQSRMHWAVST